MLFGFLLNLGSQSAEALGNALARIAHQVNRIVHPFIHREYLSETRAHEFAHDAAEGLIKMRSEPKTLLMPLILALTNKSALVIILILRFPGFQSPHLHWDDHRLFQYWIPIRDHFSHPSWHRCGGRCPHPGSHLHVYLA